MGAVNGLSLVDALRGEELDSLRSEVEAGRRAHILKTLDERGGAQELIREQYSGRYPFELIQNADDAAAERGASGTVHFELTERALVVADNGTGFGEEQVRAICTLGRTSKDPRKSIGYKGLGFKSVGEITDRPQIVSGEVRFTFDAAGVRQEIEAITGPLPPEQRVPVYAFPNPIELTDLGDDADLVQGLAEQGFRSIFRFPLRDDVDRSTVEGHLLEVLQPRLLLFLEATGRLELKGTASDFRSDAARGDDLEDREVLLESDEGAEHWRVFTSGVEIDDRSLVSPLGEAWKRIERVRVSAAVPLAADGLPSHGRPEPLHIYFPTEEVVGMPTILQGDFALELDRRHVARTPEARPFNTWLLEHLARLVGETVAPALAKAHPGEAAVLRAVAPTAAAVGFGEQVRDAVLRALQESPFVPAVDGPPRTPIESSALPASLTPVVEEAHQFIDLAAWPELLPPEAESDPACRRLLTEDLGTPALDLSDVADRVAEVEPENDEDFYRFLVGWYGANRQVAKALAAVPCVRTLGGGWMAPTDTFFPRQRDDVRFPAGLRVPIAAVPDIDGLHGLLDEAGVRSFEWRQLLPEFVLPLVTNPETPDTERSLGLEAMRSYFATERGGDVQLKDRVGATLLPATAAHGGPIQLVRADEMYFSQAWLGRGRLEQIYGGFGREEFLAEEPPIDDDAAAERRAFFQWLGVEDRPRIHSRVTDRRNEYMTKSFSRHPHTRLADWKTWWSDATTIDASRCEDGHTESQQLVASYALDRFDELVAAASADRLRVLWAELSDGWPAYGEAMSARFRCQHTAHGAAGSVRSCPSLIAFQLTRRAWVPCQQAGDPVLVAPSDAWRLTRETPGRIASRVPALPTGLDVAASAALIASLGVVDAARPSPEDLVGLLRQLASEHAELEDSEDQDLLKAARWAERTLNDVLDEAEPAELGDVPLLATLDGRHCFDLAPYVSLDPLIRDTWERDHPILDGDRDLGRLHRTLSLLNLDAKVTIRPDPKGIREDLQQVFIEHIERAKPFIAAVAVHTTPSGEEDIYRRLAGLEVVVCDDLVLEYELDDEVRTRQEAVAFLAVRTESQGIIRRAVGTAHLEIDKRTGAPHWFQFGPQLAEFLRNPRLDDAIGMLLKADDTDRYEMLDARRIPWDAVADARQSLDHPPEDDQLERILDSLTSVDDQPVASGDTEGAPGPSAGGTESAPGADVTEDSEPTDEPEEPPDIDHDAVEATDVLPPDSPAPPSDPGPGSPGGGGAGFGPSGSVDHASRERQQRRIGWRGEEVAYEWECRRLKSAGLDPPPVVWRSKSHEFATYDIESIDPDDGQRIYIEVKSTSEEDPATPFEISEAELRWAMRHGSRYWIYRVTSTNTATPRLTRYQDPAAWLRSGAAHLRLSGARLSFISANEPGPE